MENNLKILLVDDEESIRMVVKQALEKEHFKVLCAADGEEGWQMFQKEQPDLIILDIMLPERDGFELCRMIREESTVPIIMLTAKSDIADKSAGFNMGADDYLTKPFSPIELVLRVRALARRSYPTKAPNTFQDTLRFKNLIIDAKTREVIVRGNKVELTAKEFDLLFFLASHPGQVFTREQIFNYLWEDEYLTDPGTITVFIRKIRSKIEEDPSKPQFVRTVWGVGYKFVPVA